MKRSFPNAATNAASTDRNQCSDRARIEPLTIAIQLPEQHSLWIVPDYVPLLAATWGEALEKMPKRWVAPIGESAGKKGKIKPRDITGAS